MRGARPRARRFCEAGQAQTAGVAGAGATGMTTVLPTDTLDGRQQRRPRGRLLPHPARPEPRPPPTQPRGLQPSNGRWWRCWSSPAAPTAPAIALAERVCAELGSNAEIQVLEIADQQAAEQARSLARQPSGSTAATSSRAPRNASNTCIPVGSIRQAQPARAPRGGLVAPGAAGRAGATSAA